MTWHYFKYTVLACSLLLGTVLHAQKWSNRNYRIVSPDKYAAMGPNGVYNHKYIVLPMMDNADVLCTTTDAELRLRVAAWLLTKRKIGVIKACLASRLQPDATDQLIRALVYFANNQYAPALEAIQQGGAGSYPFLHQLLMADCTYELSGSKREYMQVLPLYQRALDLAATATEKEIVQNRIRIIKFTS